MSFTLAMLSWGARLTLQNTLESYKYHELDKFASQKVIFFQEISKYDRTIAQGYGYDAIGSTTNIGIGAAYKELVDYSASSLFLFLENDWLLIEEPWEHLRQSIWLLSVEGVDVVRLRHRHYPGDPLWTRQFAGNELSRPEHLLDSIHWTDPDKFPQVKKVSQWYLTEAKYANWTNNPTMFRTDWLRKNIVPRLTGDIERAIQPWWQEQTFVVAQGQGLFTHMRLDR